MSYVSGCSSKWPFTTITTQTLARKYREVLLLSTMDLFDPTVLATVVFMALLLLVVVVVVVSLALSFPITIWIPECGPVIGSSHQLTRVGLGP